MRVALCQMTSSDGPVANAARAAEVVRNAAVSGAKLICTPEVTNCVSQSRAHQEAVLTSQDDDATLAALQDVARAHSVWVSLGSVALKTVDADGRFANRSFLIAPDGSIAAQYDKLHMFDVTVSESESYRESAAFRPGNRAVMAETPLGKIGLTICYDIRFAHLYRRLAQAGAEIILVPSAFSPVTGAAHWRSLLRARAIETGSFIIAAAQTGRHDATEGRPRGTHGHSMVVSPWGEVRLDAGTQPGVHLVEIDPAEVAEARRRIPSLTHDAAFEGP